MSFLFRALCAMIAGLGMIAAPRMANAQQVLPAVTVTGDSQPDDGAGSLTVPDTEQAIADIERTPGGVAVVPDTQFKNAPAQTVKDVLGWVPGIFVQSRYGDDARMSIRGSGLSRNYGNRGLNLYMDGIPINTSDGLVDNFEIDPTAYRYVEVYKGANALRYGSNSLGGAINFVTPTGRDAAPFEGRIDVGSFGYRRAQASAGAAHGAFDYFITASAQRFDGYRDHSDGDQQRASGNIGYRFSADAETRLYLNVNRIRQRLPGEVTKDAALHDPRTADAEFERLDQQRNIDSIRLADKTTLRFGPTTLEFGVFGVHRHVMHPIYQWLDYRVNDYGGFVRAADDRTIAGFRNRLVAGFNVHNGSIDTNQYVNLTGARKGALAASMIDTSKNISAYAENTFFVGRGVAVVAGAQFQHAVREREDRFLSDGDQSGRRSYGNFSPKVGVLWDVDPAWQVFANVSRSAEAPTFDANTFATPASSELKAQTATTYEIGTRGRRRDLTWDISFYRAGIRNELQCLTTAPWSPCTVVNAGRTVHQGIELGFGAAFLESAFERGDRFWFNAAYTYSDFHFDGDPQYGGNRLPGVPMHAIRAEVLYKHPGGFYAGPNVEWMPKAYYADNANTETVDPYVLLNVRVGYANAKPGWSGYVEGRNLSNRRYIANVAVAGTATATSALFNPGSGRSVHAGLQYKW
ncbi:Fe(3+) dicitrate transport protein FecA precursor [Pigmentiphaga humi]|uniref:Fe(3+) dicitrate transport protein FecA n=1 Tax=Pigmentiphaga humi TaxID=2478468 RepID=A0A3P4B458_9BURK|nr:TonB-dependent receptor [Pigmentiphaga humi]VCU71073.1 Fe(3+) dicitrate transport protein FecA precursor [Pigmentiphaga humi]